MSSRALFFSCTALSVRVRSPSTSSFFCVAAAMESFISAALARSSSMRFPRASSSRRALSAPASMSARALARVSLSPEMLWRSSSSWAAAFSVVRRSAFSEASSLFTLCSS